MADEKKPKIDLKARLGKTNVGTPAPPQAVSSSGNLPGADISAPAPAIPPPAISSVPGMSGPGLPVPPGIPVGSAPRFDPTNPLAAAMAPRASVPVAPLQPQRIEVDEMAVQQAAKKARRTGMVFAAVALLMGVGVGVVGGQASQQGSDRTRAKEDAADLKTKVDEAKKTLDTLATKLEDGQKSLSAKDINQRKFPDSLAKELGGIHVDFDGTQLAGRRFSGFSTDTAGLLFDFVTRVQALNDEKDAVKNLLTKLQKPISEQFAALASGQTSVGVMVLLGGQTGRDPQGNYLGVLSPIVPPIVVKRDAIEIPKDLKGLVNGNPVGVPKYTGGSLAKDAAAVYITPGSFNAVCPSEQRSQAAMLGIKLGDLIREIRGEPQTQTDIVTDTKPGLIEEADKLSKGLQKTIDHK